MRSLELRSRDGVTSRARDGVTSRDGVTPGPRNDVTSSDVIGRLPPSSQFGNWSSGSSIWRRAQDLNLPLAYSQLEHLIGEDRRIDDRGARSDLKLAFGRSIDGQSAVVADQERLGSLRTARGQFPPVAKNAHRKNVSSATTRRRGSL